MNLRISFELDRVNNALTEYIRAGRKLPEAAVRLQSDKFGWFLYDELKKIAPPKGSVTSEGLALLQSRRGVRVRESVRAAVLAKYGARQDLATRQTRFGRGKRGRASTLQGGRRLNLQALAVRRELSTRESGRGFLSVAAHLDKLGLSGDRASSESRSGALLGKLVLQVQGPSAETRFTWGTLGKSSLAAAIGLSQPRAEAAIANALAATAANMRTYIEGKARQFGRER